MIFARIMEIQVIDYRCKDGSYKYELTGLSDLYCFETIFAEAMDRSDRSDGPSSLLPDPDYFGEKSCSATAGCLFDDPEPDRHVAG